MSVLVRLMVLPLGLFGMIAVLANLVADPPFKVYVTLWLITGLFVDTAYGIAASRQLRTGFRTLAAGRVRSAVPAAAR